LLTFMDNESTNAAVDRGLPGRLAGEYFDGAFSLMSDHFVHEVFEAGDKRFWGIVDRSGAERRMRVVLDDEFGKFTGRPPERLRRDEQCRFETSYAGAGGKEIAIHHHANAARDSFGRSQLGQDR
jgi:hypothetical protein